MKKSIMFLVLAAMSFSVLAGCKAETKADDDGVKAEIKPTK